MKIIKTWSDIERLGDEHMLPTGYLDYLGDMLHQLRESLGDDASEETFSLEEHGPIIVLEAGDDPRKLSCVGLPAEGGLLASWPEFVERINLGDGDVYRVMVLMDN